MQEHKNQPLNDFIEYPHDEMLKRAEEFLAVSQRRHSIR
ncbi:MAG TPA: nitroreductase family protein, partial [Pseudoalteromonas shioyasakiensis]|nr:nitroreductase family protein [Pseudoalteromonas shioyasakiensis]